MTNNKYKLSSEVEQTVNAYLHLNQKIRYLNSKGYSTYAISKILGVSYQRVYNPLHTQVKNKNW